MLENNVVDEEALAMLENNSAEALKSFTEMNRGIMRKLLNVWWLRQWEADSRPMCSSQSETGGGSGTGASASANGIASAAAVVREVNMF